MSAGKNGKYTKNRFFLIADNISKKGVVVYLMGTKNMLAHINTKPM
jgi:hypothetical protein